MLALGFGWADTTTAQVYTVHDLYPFLANELVRRGAARWVSLGTSAALRLAVLNTRWLPGGFVRSTLS